jgi:hypothetical protein
VLEAGAVGGADLVWSKMDGLDGQISEVEPTTAVPMAALDARLVPRTGALPRRRRRRCRRGYIIGGRGVTEGRHDALESELHLMAGCALRSIGPGALLLLADAVEISFLEVDDLERLTELSAERLGLRHKLGDAPARAIKLGAMGFAVRACRRVQGVDTYNQRA